MQTTVPLEAYVEIWTREAVRLHGDNWVKIADFIQTRMTELLPAARKDIEQSASLTLASQPPQSERRGYH